MNVFLELSIMSEEVSDNWERTETEIGIPYYIDHRDKKTYWNHPLFAGILELLKSCDSIKYSAYRTAAKIRILQNALNFGHVRLGVIAGVFEQHGLSSNENASCIECGHLEAVLSDIFFVAKTEVQAINGKQFDQHIVTELTLNLLLNTFDAKRRGTIKVLDVKVVLAILSCGLNDPAMFIHRQKGREKWAQSRLMECYHYLFYQISGGNGKPADREGLSKLFSSLATFVGEFLKEWRSFGLQFVPCTLYSCLLQGNEQLVMEEDFLKWLNSGPRLMAWFTTLHRMMAAETVKHEGVRCILCRSTPITGLRFRCLNCLMHDQCQDCFLHGKTNSRHKLNHPMYEYCLPTTGKEDRQALMKTLKNKVKSSRFRGNPERERIHEGSFWERRSVSYVADEENLETDANNIGETQMLIQEMELTTKAVKGKQNNAELLEINSEVPCPPRYPKEELSSIIGHLEEGHRDLGEQIEGFRWRERGAKGLGGGGLLGMCIKGSGRNNEGEDESAEEEWLCLRQLRGTREQLEEQVIRLKALQECLQKIQPSLSNNYRQPLCLLESTPMPQNNRVPVSLTRHLPRLDDLSPILARGENHKKENVQPIMGDASESIGAFLSNYKHDKGDDPSEVELGVNSRELFSRTICNLTEVSPNDLSTVLMARWRGGMKGFMGSSHVEQPRFPSSSILQSPIHSCPSTERRSQRNNKTKEQETPGPLVEIQRDLDWVLGELDAMLISSQINDESSSSSSGVDLRSSFHEDPEESLENKRICTAASHLEDLLAGLIRVVERQKLSEKKGKERSINCNEN